MFKESDKVLVLFFLGCLLLIPFIDGAPIVEAFQKSRLFSFTVLGIVGWGSAVTVLGKRTEILKIFNDWWPVVAICFAYESLKHLHANKITLLFGITPLDDLMIRIDRLLFGSPLPLYFQVFAIPWFEKFLAVFYFWGYYLFPVVMLGYAYFKRSDYSSFIAIRRGVIVSCVGAYLMYILIPVGGPLFVIGAEFTVPSISQSIMVNQYHDNLRYNWDCFPSMHTALPWLLTFLSWRILSPWLRGAAVITSLLITLSTLVLRFHYGIDLIAGLVWAYIVFLAVRAER